MAPSLSPSTTQSDRTRHETRTILTRNHPYCVQRGKRSHYPPVVNRGDRPIQVGSHFHFAETNSALDFDRDAALGKRLDIPAGTAVRFEPGDAATVQLIDFGGTREIYGFRVKVNGRLSGTING